MGLDPSEASCHCAHSTSLRVGITQSYRKQAVHLRAHLQNQCGTSRQHQALQQGHRSAARESAVCDFCYTPPIRCRCLLGVPQHVLPLQGLSSACQSSSGWSQETSQRHQVMPCAVIKYLVAAHSCKMPIKVFQKRCKCWQAPIPILNEL